ncbi:MAG: putative ABC transporter permease [Clostridiales bacterium]|nr:putative ABC transporter permease [Clostridiales bacterium]
MELFWYGVLYSFLGFLLEVAFAHVTGARKKDRKCFLLLPLCPVYGLGAVGILLLPPAVQGSVPLLFLGSAAVASLAEYGMGWFYERCWGVAFWNYRALPGNVKGRVCLPFSLCWGALGVVLVRWAQPWVAQAAAMLPGVLLPPAAALLAADFVCSGLLLRQTRSTDSLRWYRQGSRG